jgi:hypothetical protein
VEPAQATSVDAGSRVEVRGRIEREMTSQQQPTEIIRPSVIACAAKYHPRADSYGSPRSG